MEHVDIWQFIASRWEEILFASAQHLSLVVQSLVVATALAIAIAALVYTSPGRSGAANAVSAIGLTVPSFALIGLMVAPLGFGVAPAVVVIVFFAVLPILRNAIVGLAGVDRSLVESAKGIGMSRMRTFARVELPLAWPVILSGVRISAQMVMGIAAVAAYVLGPGLGGFIFQGLSRLGGAGALESIVVGTVGVVILAAILDLILVGVGRLTTSKGIRV
ncbi:MULTISPECIES: ABC transporter permease [unclassified Agrococcus]|uniref:ABC transporter permease n=1 Tax=unclassified Agrococcus TaxID=2615065 RepID=UPI0036154815